MNDRIYIKENQPPAGGGKGPIFLIAIAAVLIIVGVIGVLYSLTNNSTPSDTSSVSTSTSDVNENNNEVNTTPQVVIDEDEVEPDTTPVPANPNQSGDHVAYEAPEDDAKVNVYFPKSPETDSNPDHYVAVLRDKPAENVLSFVITQTLSGPSTQERSQGYRQEWQLSGDSQCGGSLYRYNLSGSTLVLTLCKEFSGKVEFLEESLAHTIRQVSDLNSVNLVDSSGNDL